MPYNPKSGQALAVFLQIKRTKGLAAAKSFGRQHRGDISMAMKSNQNARGGKRGTAYVSRDQRGAGAGAPPFRKKSRRSGGLNQFTAKQAPPAFMRGTQA